MVSRGNSSRLPSFPSFPSNHPSRFDQKAICVKTSSAYAATFPKDPKHAFDSIPVDKFGEDLAVNVTSAYAALKSAVEGFERLPVDATKVFIYTGNMSTGIIVPEAVVLGVGKNAVLYLVEAAVQLYGHLAARFYVGDERDRDGNSTMDKIDGEAHAVAYWELATSSEQGPINYTFVKGIGYKKFDVDRASRPVEGVQSLMKKAADAVAARKES